MAKSLHGVEVGADATDADLVQQLRYLGRFRKTGVQTSLRLSGSSWENRRVPLPGHLLRPSLS
jgi:hypothetical protein